MTPMAKFLGRSLSLVTLPLLLIACAPTAQQQADYGIVQRSDVSSAIYDKMVHGDPLSVNDVAAMSHARVPDGVIIRYIRDHGTIYYLSPPDVDYLQKAGVAQSVIDFMLATAPPGPPPGPYPVYGPPVSIGVIFGPSYGGWHHWR